MSEDIVSVIVLSYNSANTIIGTLDSIYEQDYKWIELIIADDSSNDNTIELVNQWLRQYESRFVGVKKMCHTNNSGVTVNANDGISISGGKWIKCIAADDKLLEDCISNNLKFAIKNKAKIVFSNMHYCAENRILQHLDTSLKANLEKFSKKTAKGQYKSLLKENCLPAPTAFFSKTLFDEVGGFDEEIKMMEDWPFWLKVTRHGTLIWYNNVFSVNYRVEQNSISHSNGFYRVQQQVKRKYCYDNIPKYHVLYYYHEGLLKKKYQIQDKIKAGTKKYKIIELIYAILWPPYLVELVKEYI